MNSRVNRGQGIRRSFGRLFRARAPWAVAIVLLAIHAGVEWSGGYQRLPWWFQNFGLTREGEFGGKVWQAFSYGLLHGNWLHALVNVACLVMLGARLEHALGSGVVLRAMLWGIIGGAVGHLLLSPGRPDDSLLVGSSGAAFGLMILMTTLAPESRLRWIGISGRALGAAMLAASLLLALSDPGLGLPGLSQAGEWVTRQGLDTSWKIGHGCHFGGGLAGWIYGRWLLRSRVTLQALQRQRAKREGEEG